MNHTLVIGVLHRSINDTPHMYPSMAVYAATVYDCSFRPAWRESQKRDAAETQMQNLEEELFIKFFLKRFVGLVLLSFEIERAIYGGWKKSSKILIRGRIDIVRGGKRVCNLHGKTRERCIRCLWVMSFLRYVKRSATFRRNARNRCVASTSNIYKYIFAPFKMQRNASSREIYKSWRR